MDRDTLVQDVEDALDRVMDMDTPWSVYAAAAVDALGWRLISSNPPSKGSRVLASDGKALWMDFFYQSVPMTFGSHTATHWHPIQPLPAASK